MFLTVFVYVLIDRPCAQERHDLVLWVDLKAKV